MVNATLGNIKQDSLPKKLPGLSRNRPQVTVPQSGEQRISGRRFSPVEPEKRRPEIRLCLQACARTEDACCPLS